jgi:hypothetical protein
MNKIWKILAASAGIALLAGCAHKVSVEGSSMLPAAVADAKIKSGDANSELTLKVQYMAPPQLLDPPRELYYVWAETARGEVAPLGRLHVGNDRSGELKATVPYEEFRILVTAENDPFPSSPSKPAVLATDMLDVG